METLRHLLFSYISNKGNNPEAFEEGQVREHRENYSNNSAKDILLNKEIQDEIRFAFAYTSTFNQFIIDLILEKATEEGNEAAKNTIKSLVEKGNFDILTNINAQQDILLKFKENINFEPLVKKLILEKANSSIDDVTFENFDSFHFSVQNNYNLSTFMRLCNDIDPSEITEETKSCLIQLFEFLPLNEKNKFDLHKLFDLKSDDLKWSLINSARINIEITKRDNNFESNFRSLILGNKKMSNNELSDCLSQKIKHPFLRLFIFLQLVGNSYSYRELNKIISQQDYELLKNTLKKLESNKEELQKFEEFFSYFLLFYQHLDGVELDENDKKLLKKYQEPLSPRDLFCGVIEGFYLYSCVAVPSCLLPGAFLFTMGMPEVAMLISAVLMLAYFIITPIYFLIKGINHNKAMERRQNQFKPKEEIGDTTLEESRDEDLSEASVEMSTEVIEVHDLDSNNQPPSEENSSNLFDK